MSTVLFGSCGWVTRARSLVVNSPWMKSAGVRFEAIKSTKRNGSTWCGNEISNSLVKIERAEKPVRKPKEKEEEVE